MFKPLVLSAICYYRLDIVKLFCVFMTLFSGIVHDYLCTTEVIPNVQYNSMYNS